MRPTTVTFKQPKTQEEYMDLVAKFSWLVNFDLERAEKFMEEGKLDQLAEVLPRLAVNVMTVRNFREGFIDAFPQRSGIQKDLYANQDHFEDRAYRLIACLKEHPKYIDKYSFLFQRLCGGLIFN